MKSIQLTKDQQEWYEAEVDTANLIQAIAATRPVAKLSGNDIYELIRLTWISKGVEGEAARHWQGLKVPAVGALFNRQAKISDDLTATVASMNLPPDIAALAVNWTGMINVYPRWRGTIRTWCQENRKVLLELINRALAFSSDQARVDAAVLTETLPAVPSPDGKAMYPSERVVSPLLACLDSGGRFPMVNGRADVTALLRKLRLENKGFSSQVEGLINLVGQFGIVDAFWLDVSLAQLAEGLPDSPAVPRPVQAPQTPLKTYDDAERIAIQKSASVVYRQRHNTMTNALKTILRKLEILSDAVPAGRYDALIRNYNGKGRDLLIEAKPDPDRGSIRIAIGQIFDYRRYLDRRGATDTAILTISPPDGDYLNLLKDLGITALWFTSEKCTKLDGDGRAWPAIRTAKLV